RIRWPWYSGLLLLCIISQILDVEASNDDLKSLILEIKADLGHMNYRMNTFNNKLDNIGEHLVLVKGTVETIESSTLAMEGRSSESNTATKRMATKHQELVNLVNSLNGKIQSMETRMLRVDDTVGNLQDNLDLVKGIVKTTENTTIVIEATSSATLTATTNIASQQLNDSDRINIINEKIQTMDSTMNNKIQNLKEELRNAIYPNRCPGGFFVSTRCFQTFKTHEETWAGADEVCRTNGLRLAETTNDLVARELVNKLFERYGEAVFWVNAGNQSQVLGSQSSDGEVESIERGPLELHENLTSMHNGHQCLKTHKQAWRTGKQYYTANCTQSGYPLCERYIISTNQETKLSLMEVYEILIKK
ncbi:unnamed protein product, partial [Meganyctiphanes norvegica]